MNKKGTAILLISSIAFLTAMIIFFSSVDKLKPGGGDKVVGGKEISLFKIYYEGEEILLYIDLAAKHSLKKSEQERGVFEENFIKHFKKHVNHANAIYGTKLNAETYTITKTADGIVGMAGQQITLTQDKIEYTIIPNFVIKKT